MYTNQRRDAANRVPDHAEDQAETIGTKASGAQYTRRAWIVSDPPLDRTYTSDSNGNRTAVGTKANRAALRAAATRLGNDGAAPAANTAETPMRMAAS